jgi:hypothetical protein
MKISKYLALGLLVINLTPVWGQEVHTIDVKTGLPVTPNESNKLAKFNLDFPGGTPKELVAAIQKAIGKSLNAIVSDEFASMKLPPLKMNNVDVPRLFQTLEFTSQKIEAYVIGTSYGGLGSQPQYQQMRTSYGFKTLGTPSDDSIWYFYAEKPSLPPLPPVTKVCRFYQLAPYLERGLTVNDITTAIQTGWKMQGDTSPPQISFHKETKLLIAVGEPNKLEVIDNVLKALQSPPQNPADGFQDRLKQIIKNATPPSVPVAPAPKLPEQPEAGQ